MFKYIPTFVLTALLGALAIAQTPDGNQTVRGIVVDADSEAPLTGATIQLVGAESPVGAMAGVAGDFSLTQVPVGRQTFVVSYLGYETQTIPNVLVTVGKEVILTISLTEAFTTVDEVTVVADADKDLPRNEMAAISVRIGKSQHGWAVRGARWIGSGRTMNPICSLWTSNWAMA